MPVINHKNQAISNKSYFIFSNNTNRSYNDNIIPKSNIIYSDKNQINHSQFYIGLTLALLSSLFIGSSFIIKKKGLLKLGINPANNLNSSDAIIKSRRNSKTLRACNFILTIF